MPEKDDQQALQEERPTNLQTTAHTPDCSRQNSSGKSLLPINVTFGTWFNISKCKMKVNATFQEVLVTSLAEADLRAMGKQTLHCLI